MKKRIISLVLALVMCVGLAVPAFAAPADSLDANTIGSIESPRYAVYKVPYTIDLDNNTYASIMFLVSEKGGTTCFEGVESISFYTTNPNGSHWKILEHNYTFSGDEFHLIIRVLDMEGDKQSQSPTYIFDHVVLSFQVTRNNLSAEDENAVFLIPDSVCVVYPEEMKSTLSAKDGDAVFLIPDSVNISYPEENITLKAEIVSF